ncbi:hypothetical protein GCM10007063_01490 [Lentibacillus kapialis]|uniref:Uncharacterized protein n=1 Tax=Lentibacillus kapialis TaxID=340214 RepID=A0A917USI2_9BACI|nr:hypothetical protein [Lentibacillus kapialis]GGJ82688.1 hypothetical protein GCM10007063_01490 [Lentibacillus kapialis]
MKQILISLFIGLIVCFGIIGYFQTTVDTDNIVEEENNNSETVILN